MKKLLLFLFLLFSIAFLPTFLNAQTNTARMISGVNYILVCPYTVQATDVTKLDVFNSASACVVNLPPASSAGFSVGTIFSMYNQGAGSVSVSPVSGTIGGKGTIILAQGQGMDVYSDGVNWNIQPGSGTGGGGGSIGTCTANYLAYWNSTSTIGCLGSAISGALLQNVNSAPPAFAVEGLPLGNSNLPVTSCPYTVQPDTSTTTVDRGTVLVFNSASACSVTINDPTVSGMGNSFPIKMSNIGAGTVTVNRQTAATFTVVNGSTVTSAVTSLALATGQYITLHSDNTNWWGEEVATSPLFLDASLFSGSDASVKINACNTALAGVGGICDDRALSGVQAMSQQINIGNSGGDAITHIFPSDCTWTWTLTGGTSDAILQYSKSAITGSAPLFGCRIENASTTNGMKAMYETATVAGYYRADHFTLYNTSAPLNSGAAMLIASAVDNSVWRDFEVLNYATGQTALLLGNSATPCCSVHLLNMTLNNNYTGGTLLKIVSNSSGIANGIEITGSIDHPAATYPVFSCTDTSSTHNTVIWMHDIYTETSNADTTTTPFQNSGCNSIGVARQEVKFETASATAPVWTLDNTVPTSFDISDLSCILNCGSVTAMVQNNNTTQCPSTPCNVTGTQVGTLGYELSHYSTNTAWADNFQANANVNSPQITLTNVPLTSASTNCIIGSNSASAPTGGLISCGGGAATALGGGGITSAIMFGGWTSSTPTGTQLASLSGKSALIASGSTATNDMVAPRAMTITGIAVQLSAAEGGAATLPVTVGTCTPSAGTCTPSTTLVTCTVGNSATSCSASGFSVAVTAGQLMALILAQTGTGSAAVGTVSVTYQ